jgi:hypothetical protein
LCLKAVGMNPGWSHIRWDDWRVEVRNFINFYSPQHRPIT